MIEVPNGTRWVIWRVIDGGLSTLTEIKENWSIDDLLNAHEMLDLRMAAQLTGED